MRSCSARISTWKSARCRRVVQHSLLALAGGRPFGEATEAALADYPDFDLARNLAALIGLGLVRDIVLR